MSEADTRPPESSKQFSRRYVCQRLFLAIAQIRTHTTHATLGRSIRSTRRFAAPTAFVASTRRHRRRRVFAPLTGHVSRPVARRINETLDLQQAAVVKATLSVDTATADTARPVPLPSLLKTQRNFISRAQSRYSSAPASRTTVDAELVENLTDFTKRLAPPRTGRGSGVASSRQLVIGA